MTRLSSMFSQLPKLFPRTEFQALVKRTYAERRARGFTCWGQFVAMLFRQPGRAHSRREICGGLASSEGKLSYLGITAPARSTLAYANERRPWQLYRAVLQELLGRCQARVSGRRKFRFPDQPRRPAAHEPVHVPRLGGAALGGAALTEARHRGSWRWATWTAAPVGPRSCSMCRHSAHAKLDSRASDSGG